MTHEIPPHLAFFTPGQNQKAKQGTNSETLKRNKQIQKISKKYHWNFFLTLGPSPFQQL